MQPQPFKAIIRVDLFPQLGKHLIEEKQWNPRIKGIKTDLRIIL